MSVEKLCNIVYLEDVIIETQHLLMDIQNFRWSVVGVQWNKWVSTI
jgi:hypothetical protein